MADPSDKLSHSEEVIATRVLDALLGLDAEQVERVLAHVQRQLAPDDGVPMFARGIGGPLGKLDCDAKTKIDEITHGLWLRVCASRGVLPAEMLRDCIYLLAHGKTYRQMVMEKANHEANCIDALARLIGPFGAPELGGLRP